MGTHTTGWPAHVCMQDGDEDAQEAALVPLLNQALGFAADGVTVHHSPNCLGLCDQLLAILCGRPGAPQLQRGSL